VVAWQRQAQSQKSERRGLIQRNSSALLKPLESVEWMKALRILRQSFSQNQAAEKADWIKFQSLAESPTGKDRSRWSTRDRQFVHLAPALRWQLDFKPRRGVILHAARALGTTHVLKMRAA
jgi:ribosomal protein L19E